MKIQMTIESEERNQSSIICTIEYDEKKDKNGICTYCKENPGQAIIPENVRIDGQRSILNWISPEKIEVRLKARLMKIYNKRFVCQNKSCMTRFINERNRNIEARHGKILD